MNELNEIFVPSIPPKGRHPTSHSKSGTLEGQAFHPWLSSHNKAYQRQQRAQPEKGFRCITITASCPANAEKPGGNALQQKERPTLHLWAAINEACHCRASAAKHHTPLYSA
jgi:hypothetical protein